jgi:hypothetical protein
MDPVVFYVYVDRTNDGRPFYVGKGTLERTKDICKRNQLWKRITKKHGHHRELVMSTTDEGFAFEYESSLIAAYNTCVTYGGWGANLVPLGGTWSGMKHTDASRARMRNRVVTPETRERIRQALIGRKRPDVSGVNSSSKRMDVRTKISVGRRGKCCGELASNAKLTWELVKYIRSSPLGDRAIGRELDIAHTTIASIRKYITWKDPKAT